MADVITLDLPEIERPARPTNPLADEERAFVRLLPDLLASHRGQFVAVYQGRVIAAGATRVEVAKQAYAQVGYVPVLVRLVSDEPPVPLRLPSVWLVPPG